MRASYGTSSVPYFIRWGAHANLRWQHCKAAGAYPTIFQSFICLWMAVMWEKPTARPSWANGAVSGKRKPCVALMQQRRRLPLPPAPTLGDRSRQRSKRPKSSGVGLSASGKRLGSLIDNVRRFIPHMCEKRSQTLLLPNAKVSGWQKRPPTRRERLQGRSFPFAIVRRRWIDDPSQTASLRWLYPDSL